MKFYLSVLTSLFLILNGNSQAPLISLPEVPPSEIGFSEERMDMLDDHIEKFIADGNLPGGVFLIARKGKIAYFKNFGHSHLDKSRLYEKDDVFRLASMTKAFTTVALMQLVEEGKLRLDDPIFYYIPAFAKPTVLETYNPVDTTFITIPSKRPITIRHLLTHTSGITYGSFNPGKIQAIYEKMGCGSLGLSDPSMTTAEMADKIAGLPLIFQPGEKYMYGLNMEVLGRVIEVASGESLAAYFENHIFQPLGMKETGFYLPKELHKRLVPVYSVDNTGKIIQDLEGQSAQFLSYPTWPDNNHYAGGGGLSGTTHDYAIFLQAMVNGGTFQGNRILSRKSIDVITSDQMIRLNEKGMGFSKLPGQTYGLGFSLKTEAGQAISHKSPGTYEWGGVFNTKFFIDPQEELIFVGMTQILPFPRGDFWDKLYAIIYGSLD